MALPEIIKDINARVKKSGDIMTGTLKNNLFLSNDNNETGGGINYGIHYNDPTIAQSGLGSIRGQYTLALLHDCNFTNGAKEQLIGERCFYYNDTDSWEHFPSALTMEGDGKIYYLYASDGLTSRTQYQKITMNKYEVLHTGNISLADSRFVKKSGDTMTGQLIIESTASGSWNEGIRINAASNGWTTLILGCNKGSTAGTQEGAWSLHTNNGTFYLSHNGSSSGNPMLIGIKNTGFKIQGTLEVTGLITGTVSNADTVDGYHASSLWRSDGGTWNGGANLVCSGSSTEWSIDVKDNGTNSSYFHIWSSNLGNSMIQCWPTTGRVLIPYTLGIGSYNTSYKLYVNGASAFAGEIRMVSESYFSAYMPRKTDNGGGWAYNAFRVLDASLTDFAHFGVYGGQNTLSYIYIGANNYDSTNNLKVYPSGKVEASSIYGAVWNDYAEYRESNITQPGKCIIENGDDTLRLSTERLQRGAEIVSDTFGFAIGETDTCKTPIAASGRVLAYGYEDREQFKSHIGYPVCSGPNGTVSIMTDEEEQLYPSRIIGYISAVPDYEIWGTGNVKVDGRIWIRIK